MRTHLTAIRVASILSLTFVSTASSQTFFTEDFENLGFVPIGGWGPQGLINEGWLFENNSEPLGSIGWVAGCCWGGLIAPLSGTGYLASYQDAAAGDPAEYSNWAILPAIPGQQAGDLFGFFTISSDTSPWDNVSLQVRYSPSGGTSVGTTAQDVGDFTTVLLDITTMPNMNEGTAEGWTWWQFELPGPGRIALRQYGTSSLYFGIEDITIGHPEVERIFPEDFENLGGVCGEGPCALVDNGWVFKDQSVPGSAKAWEPNQPNDQTEPHDGFGYMKSVSAAGGVSSGGVNNWAILPAEGIGEGDVLAFFATGILGPESESGTLEVRYSPSGGIGTGSGLNGIGDFTQVLTSVSELVYLSWQPITATIPGAGRVAIRFHNPFIPAFSGSRFVGIDTLTINTAPIGPPLPQPGETVTWSLDISPIAIDADLTVAPGGTVIVEPGVVINITSGHTLSIAGEFLANATAENPITINGWAPMFPAFLDAGGFSEFTFVSMNDGRFEPTFVTNCTAVESVIDARRVVGCTFTDAGVSVVDDNLAVIDSSFTGGGISLLRGYFHVDNVTIDGGAISLSREDAAHTVYLNTLEISDSPGAALLLGGWSFYLGEANTLAGNLYPVQLSGGLASGTIVPKAGNTSNFVRLANDFSPTGYDELPPLAVPYLLTEAYAPGLGLDVLPGAQFVGLAGGALWEQYHQMRLLGLPEEPITFRGASSGPGAWHGITWSLVQGSRAEYCVVEDALFGMLVDESIVHIDNCLFRNSAHGSRTSNYGISYLRKNQFLDNQIGVSATPTGTFNLFGETNPNWIEGNGQGALEEDPSDSPDAQHNWWGHPSGPTTPDNPGGQGDSASANVDVLPFLTAPPDVDDTPPVVRLQEIARVLETNAPLVLNWDASDDGGIVSQRVLFSELGVLNDMIVLHDNLSPMQRSAMVTVPASSFFQRGYFFVQAIDGAGQIGHDSRSAPIAPDTSAVEGSFSFPEGLRGPFVTGQDIDAFPYVVGNVYAILLDDMNESIGLGVGVVSIDAPYASTDRARILAVDSNGKRFFSDYFTVRPPEYIGDAAPSVALLSPTGGSFEGGSVVSFEWTASDDEAIRGFDLQASYDDGRSWHFIRKDISAATTQYAWMLPSLLQGLAGVQVRVIAWDLRFQSSSATATIAFTPGEFGGSPADLDQDGDVDGADLGLLLGAWGACSEKPCFGDLDGNGEVNGADFGLVLGAWG